MATPALDFALGGLVDAGLDARAPLLVSSPPPEPARPALAALVSALSVGAAFLGAAVVSAVQAPRPPAALTASAFFSLGPHVLPVALFLLLNVRRSLASFMRPCPPPAPRVAPDSPWHFDDADASVRAQIAAINDSAAHMYVTSTELTVVSILLLLTRAWHFEHRATPFCQ
jgi:hypothetical protein